MSLKNSYGVNDIKGLTVAGDPFYSVWRGVIARTLYPSRAKKVPTYARATIEDSWKYFSNFKAWMETQNWAGMELDKDILFKGNKHYGPNTCSFVPKQINTILRTNKKSRGRFPIGVYFKNDVFRRKPYRACVMIDKKNKHLGNYSTPHEAHKAWQWEKANQIEKALAWYAGLECFRTDVAEALTQRVWQLRLDHVEDCETLDL